jgi:hypothetical protein
LLAPCWISIVLALEIQTARRETEGAAGDPSAVRDISLANLLWSAPRIHGELLELGIDVARRALQSTWLGGGEAVTGLENLSLQSC